ncbi:glycogen/starch synthase [Porphyromonas sp. COT-239 OH1446]|uniref:glycogen/starch synthase n=1 Tax=Porphyromonas sp. COT-239 OH1446 TaxID=1515613 RepID=UPI00052C774A|nr:glycogen/starch synthase [Porphyromonas sp. COT-239 OH1446]KGN68417.1 glycogen synthase [Porphyromonas sp. COT-239 OH1446]
MSQKRVLFISQEIFPYLPETEIATLSRKLPQSIQELGNDVRMFMPRYGLINERRNQLHEVIRLSGLNMIINNNDHPLIIKVASIPSARMQVYFIDNDDFFKRKSLYGPDAKGLNDNDERSIFFVRGALETVKKLRWIPDVIHCHGWFTALAMLYLKKVYQDDPCLKKSKIVFSVYNEPEAGQMPETLFEKLKFDNIKQPSVAMMEGQTHWGALMRLAIHHAHGVVQGSQEIAPEIQEFITQSGKPFLPYQGVEDYAAAYDQFYNQIL